MPSDWGLKDFLFGAGPLKKAAGDNTGGTQSSIPKPSLPGMSQPAGIDMAKEAQAAADRALGKAPAPSKSPLASPMIPVSKKASK